MAEDRIFLGSRLRLWLPTVNLANGTETAFVPTGMTVTVQRPRPDETMLDKTVLFDGDEAYLDFAADELDTVGTWRVQGDVSGYLSWDVEFRVHRKPVT